MQNEEPTDASSRTVIHYLSSLPCPSSSQKVIFSHKPLCNEDMQVLYKCEMKLKHVKTAYERYQLFHIKIGRGRGS
jgi:hypothetical protein